MNGKADVSNKPNQKELRKRLNERERVRQSRFKVNEFIIPVFVLSACS